MPLNEKRWARTVSVGFLAAALLGVGRISWQIWNWYGPPIVIVVLAIPTIASFIFAAIYWSRSR